MDKGYEWIFYRYRQGSTYGQEIYPVCSTSFVIWREIQLRATMRYHFIPIQLEKLKGVLISSARVDGDLEDLIPC